MNYNYPFLILSMDASDNDNETNDNEIKANREIEFEKWFDKFSSIDDRTNIFLVKRLMAAIYYRFPIFEDDELINVKNKLQSDPSQLPNSIMPELMQFKSFNENKKIDLKEFFFKMKEDFPLKVVFLQLLSMIRNDESGNTCLNLGPNFCLYKDSKNDWFNASQTPCVNYVPIDTNSPTFQCMVERGKWSDEIMKMHTSSTSTFFSDPLPNGLWSYCPSVMTNGIYWWAK